MEPDQQMMTALAREVVERPEFGEIHAALDRLPVKQGVFMAFGALANQLLRLPEKLRRDTAIEVSTALEGAMPRRADPDADQMSTEYRTEINFAVAYIASRTDKAANPAIVVTALAHVLGQVVLQIPGAKISEDQRIEMVCNEVAVGAETWSVLTEAQRSEANRKRHDA